MPVETVATGGGSAEGTAARRLPLRPLFAGALALGAVAVAAIVATLAVDRSPPTRPASAPGLPSRLAYLAASEGGSGSRVFFRTGDGRDPSGGGSAGAVAGAAPPALQGPQGDHPATAFGWSPNGRRAWVVDRRQRLRMLPEDEVVLSDPVKGAVFSPADELLAACSAVGWPPEIRVIPVGETRATRRPPVPGCDPRWSADGVYLAYRIPGRERGEFSHRRVGVLNTRLHLTFRVTGRWPAVWATGVTYSIAPLTVVAPDGRSVLLMDPRGGRRRTLVSAVTLWSLTGGSPVAPIVSMAWSVEGDRIALGVDDGTLEGADGVVIVDPRTGHGTFVRSVSAPASMTWGPGGRLLVELRRGQGEAVTLQIAGDRTVARLVGLRHASWSPDGRWILARQPTRWVAIDARNPSHRVAYPAASGGWYEAAWCCPSLPVTRVEG